MNSTAQISESFAWTNFYMEFADKLFLYKDKRSELLSILQSVYESLGIKYPFTDKGVPEADICPFTVFGCFNKGITDENRKAIMNEIRAKLGVQTKVPDSFDGIPVLNNMRAWFYGYKADRKPDDISNLWDVFDAALKYADGPSEVSKTAFIGCYDKVRSQLGIKWNITMGLFWVRPFAYLNLDQTNRSFLFNKNNPYHTELLKVSNLKQVPNAKIYLELISICKDSFEKSDSPLRSFPELSYQAWTTSNNAGNAAASGGKTSTASFLKWFVPLITALKSIGGSGTPEQVRNQIVADLNLSDAVINEVRGETKTKKFDNEVAWARNYLTYEGYIDKTVRGIWALTEKGRTAAISDQIASDIFFKWVDILKDRRESETGSDPVPRDKTEKRYWIYSPGSNAAKWDEFYTQGLTALGWDEMGDLQQYPNKEAMKSRMKELFKGEVSYKNSALATWQFANEMEPGDIVYAKKGMYKILGRGVIESEYIFDETRKEYKSIRKIHWTHNGEWDHPGQAVLKVLTDITPYTDYVQKLEALFEIEVGGTGEGNTTFPPYTRKDFLAEVFLDDDRYNVLVSLLRCKKNVILQGAPGVGKTFAAKRLAYSIMGEKDASRFMMVQFHQSYSYEDFIMGFRPSKTGFELVPGPFYQFCKIAQDDDERDYFFVIDEINRGNLSKIFGELLVLIEQDKRGEKLRLLYSNELFSVPPNVHIIGMMNTADRSLAMIDYALRRRFAFFEMEPAFDSEGFKTLIDTFDHPKLSALIEQVKALNCFISKDEALGDGFRIGHSYLCPNGEVTDQWLASVVNYELLPLLGEYWFDEREKVKQWATKLSDVLND
ncbi:MAG: AAA domain-containing protein [Veillonellaceae bacterium]|nr:AAA domain-containing protein [Veillonellaceae bacterium]